MLLSTMALALAVLAWRGDHWGSAELVQTASDRWSTVLADSDGSQHRPSNTAHNGGPGRRRRRAGPDEPSDEPLPLPDELESPAAGEGAGLETLRRYSADAGDFSVCCPAGQERTSPRAGTRRDGSLGILYTDDTFHQMFFERSCLVRVDGGDKMAERRLRRRYRCVQQYSHSYAVYNVNGTKVLDYIRIRSGCECEVKNKARRRKKRP